ncbi:YI31B [Hepatospora eriocheir]|uniref:YI31B n=1 Tax=Hepatospora eriocheir TaxID=1081669 RepID=A0A1X0Q728_9MICR|nr:YI31B [Hepatospora eriocheir]
MKDVTGSIRGGKIFSVIDLNKGFYQIPISKSDCQKTVFICPLGHFEFTRLPFGMKNAPQYFQKVIARLLEEYSFATVFVDDIII